MLYALCGMSGVGKTTIQRALLERQPHLSRLVTSTTRPPRPGEVSGVDYHFLSTHQYQTAVETKQLLCSILHRGAGYAASCADVSASRNRDLLGVLRPDKLPELEQLTSVVSFAIVRPGSAPLSDDDRLVCAHLHRCTYQIINIPGDLDHAVVHILCLLQHHTTGG